jgi:hypothetical protein
MKNTWGTFATEEFHMKLFNFTRINGKVSSIFLCVWLFNDGMNGRKIANMRFKDFAMEREELSKKITKCKGGLRT